MSIKNNIEIISLIYKSVDYLKLICDQLLSANCKVDGWKVGIRIVANDATPEVLKALKTCGVPYTVYNDPNLDDFYLNRVYRAWNFAGSSSMYDNVCFVNSDMMFSPNWLANLLKHHDGTNIPCSRLVESGKLRSGSYGIEKNFGKSPSDLDQESFNSFAQDISENKTQPGGLYMPCVFETDKFRESGMYPHGNVFLEGDQLVAGYPNDRPVYMSGDDYFFKMLSSQFYMNHVTVFDSIVYHIQEGEKDE
jgi:hypothetical protein